MNVTLDCDVSGREFAPGLARLGDWWYIAGSNALETLVLEPAYDVSTQTRHF